MNWSKIKIYIISGLLIANIFLFSLFYFDMSSFSSSFNDKKSLENIKTVLSNNGIFFDKVSDLNVSKLPVLEIYTDLKVQSDMLDQLISDSYKDVESSKLPYYRFSKLDLGISLNRMFKESDYNYLREDLLVKLADKYIADIDDKLSYRLISVEKNGDIKKSYYYQSYDGYLIRDGYIYIESDAKGIKKIDYKYAGIRESKDFQKNIPYSEVLYRVLSTVDIADTPIDFVSVDIIYQLSDSALKSDIESGDASPYFRLIGSEGEVYLIKALDIRGE